MKAHLNSRDYILFEICPKNWQAIPEGANSATVFIDGGVALITTAPTSGYFRIRTAEVAIHKSRLNKVIQKEGTLEISASLEEGKIIHRGRFINSNLDIKNGIESHGSDEMATFADMARRLAEIKAAETALNGMKPNEYIVMDGTLEAHKQMEKEAISALAAEAEKKGVKLGAVAKTCSLLTDTGQPLIEAAGQVGKAEGYILIAESGQKIKTAVARLNMEATYLFRIDCAGDVEPLISSLKTQSNDITFPGYPYGLIMADRFARISNAEAVLLKTEAQLNEEMQKTLRQARAIDAHHVLDRM